MKSCLWCDKGFQPSKHYPSQRFCSKLCGGNAWKDNNSDHIKTQGKEYRSRKGVREQINNRQKKWHKTHRELKREYRLIKNFDLTMKQYEEMAVIQDNKCAICDRPERIIDHRTGGLKRLAVDHNHVTGKIRGLLCHRCNRFLGGIEDSPYILRKALEYIQK